MDVLSILLIVAAAVAVLWFLYRRILRITNARARLMELDEQLAAQQGQTRAEIARLLAQTASEDDADRPDPSTGP